MCTEEIESKEAGRQDKTALGFRPVALLFFLPPSSLPFPPLLYLLHSSLDLHFKPIHSSGNLHRKEEGGGGREARSHLNRSHYFMTPGEVEDAISSECSSGCQSGWTTYLGHSMSYNTLVCKEDGSFRGDHVDDDEQQQQEEEDMSMVSDASSGPPQFHEEEEQDEHDYYSFCSVVAKNVGKKRRITEPEQHKEEDSSLLDDTASSLPFNYSLTSFGGDSSSNNHQRMKMEFSCGFSATHFKVHCSLFFHFFFYNVILASLYAE
ncbi:hypothetical protein Cni_G26429 [Canna indica]|uniref:Uncharacterized protein n=1 Tax=Canna indica TaxID=4628 RepID=A0AAQ3L3R6_9LILI|nr:hypothetical protein Cni_G26429 [Canna indica]